MNPQQSPGGGQEQGVSISAQSMLQAGARRLEGLNQENTMLLARTMDLEAELEKQRAMYTQLLAVCPDDVVAKARAAAEQSADSPANGVPG